MERLALRLSTIPTLNLYDRGGTLTALLNFRWTTVRSQSWTPTSGTWYIAPWLLIGTAINRSIHNDNRSITESGHYICLCKYRIYWYLRRSVWYLCQSSDLFNLLHKSLFQFLLYARTDAMPRKHEVRCPPQKYVKHAVLVLWPRGLVNLFCCCSKKTRCSSAVRGRRIHGTNYILLSDTTECCSSLSSSSTHLYSALLHT